MGRLLDELQRPPTLPVGGLVMDRGFARPKGGGIVLQLLIVVGLLIMFMALPASASTFTDSRDQVIGMGINFGVEWVFSALGVAITGLFGWASRKFGKRQDLAILEQLARQGVQLAEEAAERHMKQDTDLPRLTGDNKMNVAIDHITDQMPGVKVDVAKRVVDSVLASMYGVGATGSKSFK